MLHCVIQFNFSPIEEPIEKMAVEIVSETPPLTVSIVEPTTEPCAACVKLAAEVDHYKYVLDTTEIALSKLQQSVDQEEGRWCQSIHESVTENATVSSVLF